MSIDSRRDGRCLGVRGVNNFLGSIMRWAVKRFGESVFGVSKNPFTLRRFQRFGGVAPSVVAVIVVMVWRVMGERMVSGGWMGWMGTIVTHDYYLPTTGGRVEAGWCGCGWMKRAAFSSVQWWRHEQHNEGNPAFSANNCLQYVQRLLLEYWRCA
jgi:hypothetical protein